MSDLRARIDANERYQALGWITVPVKGKSPFVDKWQEVFAEDQKKAKQFLASADGVGVLLGPQSGIVDIECDSPRAEEELLKLLGTDEISTPTFQSQRGKHRLFRWSPEWRQFSTKNVFKVNEIEFRTGVKEGCQSVFPPFGGRKWLIEPETPVADFPAFDALRKAMTEEVSKPGKGQQISGDKVNVERWLCRHGVPVLNFANEAGDSRWFIPCPGAAKHTGKDSDRDCWVTQRPDGTLGGHCFHQSCGMDSWAKLKDAIGPIASEDFDRQWLPIEGKESPSSAKVTAEAIISRKVNRQFGVKPCEVKMIDRAAMALSDLQSAVAEIDVAKDTDGKQWSWIAAELCVVYGLSQQAACEVFKASNLILDQTLAAGSAAGEPLTSIDLRGEWTEGKIINRVADVMRFGDLIAGEALLVSYSAESWSDNHRLARRLLKRFGFNPLDDASLEIRFYRGEWWKYNGVSYQTISRDDLVSSAWDVCTQQRNREAERAKLAHIEACKKAREEDKERPKFRPPMDISESKVKNVLAAAQSIAGVGDSRDMPLWFGHSELRPPASEIVAVKNGLLHVPYKGEPVLLKSTPEFFTSCGLECEYDPAATCPKWEQTLNEYFPHDKESIRFLHQWFGYHLIHDAPFHKVAIIIGVKRSGKGTIRAQLERLVGSSNFCTPTLSQLSYQHGLAGFVGKRAAFISDARMGRSTDAVAVGERLLSIAGGDPQDVQRKYLTTLSGERLPIRFTIFSNEVPTFFDSSGALASRFIPIQMTESFYGRENLNLQQELADELSGMLNWALAGLEDLRWFERFEEPTSAKDLQESIRDISSPIALFADHICEISESKNEKWMEDNGFITDKQTLYNQWCAWCVKQGQEPNSQNIFLRNLYAAFPSVKSYRPRTSDPGPGGRTARPRSVRGLRIANPFPIDAFGPGSRVF